MLDAIGVVETVFKKPLMAVLGGILTGLMLLALWAVAADRAIASLQFRQEKDDAQHEQYQEMRDMLIRIDENVAILKEDKQEG